MNWCSIDSDYLDTLRGVEHRIPYSEYTVDGHKRFKPFFTPLFTVLDLTYITQISSPKTRHDNMKDNLDFVKVYKKEEDKTNDSLDFYGVINLNYMFPVPSKYIYELKKSNIDTVREFESEEDKSKYIDLLSKQMEIINTLDLSTQAKKLYDLKFSAPGSKISRRCLDFKDLEIVATHYVEKDIPDTE